MSEDDTPSQPTVPIQSTFRRLHQRRGMIAQIDNLLKAYWQMLIDESRSYAEAAVERALEGHAKDAPPGP